MNKKILEPLDVLIYVQKLLNIVTKKILLYVNLTSIALPRFIKYRCEYSIIYPYTNLSNNIIDIINTYLDHSFNEPYYDFKHLGEIVEMCTENCDRIIDINLNPVKRN